MAIQTKYLEALTSIHESTLAAARRGPGEASSGGFRRMGLRVPDMRAMGKRGYGFLDGLSAGEMLKTWHDIFSNTDLYEVACQAIYYYQHRPLSEVEFSTVRQWIDRCDCWEHSDDLSKIYAQVFEENADWVMPWYRKWNLDGNPWKRRQSIVGLLEYSRQRKSVQPYGVLISFIEPLLADDEYYVQKGVGWTLREIYNLYPKEVLDFIERRLSEIQPLAYSAATEKLDKTTKSNLNARRKALRSRL
jgi:3-methyladenine DNA glycosylase AlkD